MRKQMRIITAMLVLFTMGALGRAAQDEPAAAQPQPPEAAQPVAQPEAPAEQAQPPAVEGVIRATRGVLTQIRLTPDDPWQKAEVGMRVPVGAELRTGPRSMIQFFLPPDQLVTLDRATVITLLQASQEEKRAKTDIGMLRGRTTYQVTDPEVEHEASVQSPNATNAVRGTDQFGVTDDALYGGQVFSINTPTTVTNSEGEQIPFGGDGEESQMSSDLNSEGEQYFLNTILDPFNSRSRTAEETLLVGRFPGVGGLDTQQVRGTLSPQRETTFDSQLLMPRLIAMLMWDTAADLNIFSVDSDGYPLSTNPGFAGDFNFATTSPNGGFASPDLTGPAAEYIVYLNNDIPTGNFTVGAFHVDGPDSEFTIQVFKDGQLIGEGFTGIVGSDGSQDGTTIFIPHDGDGRIDEGIEFDVPIRGEAGVTDAVPDAVIAR